MLERTRLTKCLVNVCSNDICSFGCQFVSMFLSLPSELNESYFTDIPQWQQRSLWSIVTIKNNWSCDHWQPCSWYGASAANEQHHSRDLRIINRRGYEISNSSPFTRLHCIYQIALRQFLPECIAPRTTRRCHTRRAVVLFTVIAVRKFALIYPKVKEIVLDPDNSCNMWKFINLGA